MSASWFQRITIAVSAAITVGIAAVSTGCFGGASDTEAGAAVEAGDAIATADVLPVQAPAPSVGGETTDFGGGLSLCDNQSAMTFELAPDDIGPDGASVASHLEAVRGSYRVPMQWEASDASQGSTMLDVVVEPTQMVRFEMSCLTPPSAGTTYERRLIQYWSILSRISVFADDGSVVGMLDGTEYRQGDNGWTELEGGQGFFQLWASADVAEMEAAPAVVRVGSVGGAFTVVERRLKGSLHASFTVASGPYWNAELNADGCPSTALHVDGSETAPGASGRSVGEVLREIQEEIDALDPFTARWVFQHFDDQSMVTEEEGESVEVDLRVDDPEWHACSGFGFLSFRDASLVLERSDGSFAIPLNGPSSVTIGDDGTVSQIRQTGPSTSPVITVDGQEDVMQRFDLTVTTSASGTVTSGSIVAWDEPPPNTGPYVFPEKILRW